MTINAGIVVVNDDGRVEAGALSMGIVVDKSQESLDQNKHRAGDKL